MQFVDLFNKIQSPPFGIRKGVIPILLAAAMRSFPSTLSINDQKSNYLYDILPSTIEDICEYPEKYHFKVHKLDINREDLLVGIYNLFSPNQNISIREVDMLRKCFDSLEMWKHNLPKNALQTSQIGTETKLFQEIIQKNYDPEQLFFYKIPSIFNQNNIKKLLTELLKVKNELENIVNFYYLEAEYAIKKSLHCDPENDLIYELSLWSSYFPEYIISSVPDQYRKSFLERIKIKYENKNILIDNIAILLIGLPIKNWDDSHITDFNRKFHDSITYCEDYLLFQSNKIDDAQSKAGIQRLALSRIKQFYEKLKQTTDDSNARLLINTTLKEI